MGSEEPRMKTPPDDGDDRVSRQAAEWFAKLLDQDTAKSEYVAFREWLQQDPTHAEAYADLERLWAEAGIAPELEGKARRSRRTLLKGAGAAVLLAGAGLAGARYLSPAGDYRTGVGETMAVDLPDGSRIELSTSSAVSVLFDGQARHVRLLSGEAYFTVAADPLRPFTVAAGEVTTRALGTAFSVAMEGGGVVVSVAEHAVLVTADDDSVEVEAGQTVSYGDRGLSRPNETDVEAKLAWRRGQLVFISTPFGEVVAALNRWRRGRMIVMDDRLARRPVTIIVDVRRAPAFVETLEQSLPVMIDTYSPWLALIYPR